jgi:hypothetical protein
MILDEQAFRIRNDRRTLLVLNFEFLLVLNHHDVIWDYLKKEDMGKRRNVFRHTILGRVRGALGTCSRKPRIIF